MSDKAGGFLIGRHPCGCMSHTMVDDDATTNRDRADFYATAAKYNVAVTTLPFGCARFGTPENPIECVDPNCDARKLKAKHANRRAKQAGRV